MFKIILYKCGCINVVDK